MAVDLRQFLRNRPPPPAGGGGEVVDLRPFLRTMPAAIGRKRTVAQERRGQDIRAWLEAREEPYRAGREYRPDEAMFAGGLGRGFFRGMAEEIFAPISTYQIGRQQREREAFLAAQEPIAGVRLREPARPEPPATQFAEGAGRMVGGILSLAGLGAYGVGARLGARVAGGRVGTAAARRAATRAAARGVPGEAAEAAARETVRQIVLGAGAGGAYTALSHVAGNFEPFARLAREDPAAAAQQLAAATGIGVAAGGILAGAIRGGVLTHANIRRALDEVSTAGQPGEVPLFVPPPERAEGPFLAAIRERRAAAAGLQAQRTIERGLAARAAAPATTPGRGVELTAPPRRADEGLWLPEEPRPRALVGQAEHRERVLEILRERVARLEAQEEARRAADVAARPRAAGGVLLGPAAAREAPEVIVPGAAAPPSPGALAVLEDIRRRAGVRRAPAPPPPAAPPAPQPVVPAPAIAPPASAPAGSLAARIAEIDALTPSGRRDLAKQLNYKTADDAYRMFLTGRQGPLARGETWRARALAVAAQERAPAPVAPPAPAAPAAPPPPAAAPSVAETVATLRGRLQQVQSDLIEATRIGDEGRIAQLAAQEQGLVGQLRAQGEQAAPTHPTIRQIRARAPRAPAVDLERVRSDEPLAPALQLRTGAAARVFDQPGGASAEVRYAVVDARDPRVITSHSIELTPDARFPSELQIRGRARAASEAQIQQIMTRLEPEQLGENILGAHGAPVLGPDGLVESGNGRMIALRRLYATRGTNAEGYRAWLAANAERFGLSRADVEGLPNPVLVRVRTSRVPDRVVWTQNLNRPGVAGLGALERARVDADALTDDVLGQMQADDLTAQANRGFVRAFFERAGAREEDLTAEGFIAQGGVARLRNALFAKAYGTERPSTLARIAESTSDQARNLSNAMIGAAPRIARLREMIRTGERFEDLDIFGTDLLDAADLFARAKAPGAKVSVEEILTGESLLPETQTSEAAREILRRINEFRASGPALRRYLDSLADAVDAAGSPRQTDMFGRTAAPRLGDVLQVAYAKATGAQVGLALPTDVPPPRAPVPATPPPAPTTPAPSPVPSRPEADPIGEFLRLGPLQRRLVREAVDEATSAWERAHPQGGRLAIGQIARDAWTRYARAAADEGAPPIAPKWFNRLIRAEQAEAEQARIAAVPSVATATAPARALPTAAAAPAPEPVSIGDLVAYLNERVVPVRVGRLGRIKAGTKGVYKTGPEVARTREALDLETIPHEVGHHLDKHLNLASLPSLGQVGPLASSINLSAYPSHQIPRELVAEYVRTWLTDPALAERVAPTFTKEFTAKLATRPEWLRALQETQRRISDWQRLPSKMRILGRIGQTPERTRRGGWDQFYQALVEELQPLARAVQGITGGAKVPIGEDPYRLRRLARGWAGKAEVWLRYGRTDREGKIVGPGLHQILSGVRGQNDDFKALLIARHADELHRLGRKTGFAQSDIDDVIATLGKNQKLNEAIAQYVNFNNSLLDELVDAGGLSAQLAQSFKDRYPYFVSFKRIFREVAAFERERAGPGRRLADKPPPIHTIRDSTREIVDPIESAIRRTYSLLSWAEHNRVKGSLINLAKKYEGAGRWVEEVPLPTRAIHFRLREVQKFLEDSGADLSAADLDRMAMIFQPTGRGAPQENIVLHWRGGKVRAFQLEPELYRVVNDLNRESASLLVELAGYPARLLRAGAILQPDFPIRNLFRDQIMAGVFSEYGYVPYVDYVRGLLHILGKTNFYHQLHSLGGAQATLTALDRNTMARTMRELAGNPALFERAGIRYIRHPIDLLADVGNVLEEATRVGAAARAMHGGIIFGRRTPTQERLLEGSLEARDIVLDYARVGDAGRNINRLVAFWNARMQGLDKMRRAFIERPLQTTTKAILYVTVPSVINYAYNRNDPEYQSAPQWAKDLFWMVPGVRIAGRRVWIPKPFELGILFGTIPERILQWLDTQDPQAFAQLTDTLTAPFTELLPAFPRRTATGEWTVGVGAIPNAFLPFLELAANYDLFQDRHIVPLDEERLPARLQYGPFTPTVAREVGGRLGISPRKLEHGVEAFTAGLGRYAMEMPETLGLVPRRPGELRTGLARVPGLRGFTPVTPYAQSQDLQDFYVALKRWEGEARGRRLEGQPEGEAGRHAIRLRHEARVIADLRRRRDRILADERLSAQERREQSEAVARQMIDRARRGLERRPLGPVTR